MILSDITIEKLLAEGSLAIEPLEPAQIQPASVDIRLGDTFSIVEDTPSGIVGLEDEIAYKTIRTDRYILLPGQFVLATTMEYVRLGNDLTAFVEGRSSLGRMGLFVQNAGWVDPGFEGGDHARAVQREPLRARAAHGAPCGTARVRPARRGGEEPVCGQVPGAARRDGIARVPRPGSRLLAPIRCRRGSRRARRPRRGTSCA